MKNIIFYKSASIRQGKLNYYKQLCLRTMPDKEGYNKVYMPYGEFGRGFYYVKQKEEKNEKES